MTTRFARLIGRRLRDEGGFTVVEGIVAALLLVAGALGVLQILDASTRTNFRAEQSQALNNHLQAELEQVKQLPYSQIALTGYPESSADPESPLNRVSDTKFVVSTQGAAQQEDLVVNGQAVPGSSKTVSGGVIDPAPREFSVGDISGHTYTFVTWTSDPNCPQNQEGANACGEGAIKKVTVVAEVDDAAVSFTRADQQVQTTIADDTLVPDDNPAPPGEPEEGNVAEFWLTDTTCDNATRQPLPTEGHPAHNTRGRCVDGKKEGNQGAGAPDLLFTEAPAWSEDPQPLIDYATDLEPPAGSPPDIGLQMPWSNTDSCLLQPVLNLVNGIVQPVLGTVDPLDGVLALAGGETNKYARVHTWLSPKIAAPNPPSLTDAVLTGEGNLDLWTKTINGAQHPGEICVSVFIRQTIDVQVLPSQLCLPLLGCVQLNLGIIDLTKNPPQVCLPLVGCVNLNVSLVKMEVDVPLVNVGVLTNQDGTTCHQGLNLTYFRCSRAQWPTEWSKLSIPLDFLAVNTAGQLVPPVLPPNSQVGVSLMVKKSGTQPGQGLEFMYDHPDFESRLQLKTSRLLDFDL